MREGVCREQVAEFVGDPRKWNWQQPQQAQPEQDRGSCERNRCEALASREACSEPFDGRKKTFHRFAVAEPREDQAEQQQQV